MENSIDPGVEQAIADFPAKVRARALELRERILSTAAETDDVGPLRETLKWGEPSYLTDASKSGTTIRISWQAKNPGEIGLCVHCQATLVDGWRERYSDELTFDGNRRVVFPVDAPLPGATLTECIADALTYHRNRRKKR